jgi:hypothetical protein
MLNPHARFTSFVIGSANRLAATAAKAVAESPGAAYNPLFIYATPGLGKTHLLMAIGHGAQEIDASRTVEYVTVDDFVEAYHAALAAGQAETYRRRFTEADLVLLDDAQLLTGRRELQSELLRLIDLLTAADRQIVLAGDRPPEEIQSLDERLIRRFAGGLVIDIGAPDYETRLAILTRRAEERQVTFSPEVLAAVAEPPIATALLRGFILFPEALHEHYEELVRLAIADRPTAALRDELVQLAASSRHLDRDALQTILADKAAGVDVRRGAMRFSFTQANSNPEVALKDLAAALEVVIARAEIETALDEATKRFGEDGSDGRFAEQQRLFEAKQSYNDRLASLASSD